MTAVVHNRKCVVWKLNPWFNYVCIILQPEGNTASIKRCTRSVVNAYVVCVKVPSVWMTLTFLAEHLPFGSVGLPPFWRAFSSRTSMWLLRRCIKILQTRSPSSIAAWSTSVSCVAHFWSLWAGLKHGWFAVPTQQTLIVPTPSELALTFTVQQWLFWLTLILMKPPGSPGGIQTTTTPSLECVFRKSWTVTEHTQSLKRAVPVLQRVECGHGGHVWLKLLTGAEFVL